MSRARFGARCRSFAHAEVSWGGRAFSLFAWSVDYRGVRVSEMDEVWTG
jgi:hypothetical protein